MCPKPIYAPIGETRRFFPAVKNFVEMQAAKALRENPNGLWDALVAAHKSSRSIGITTFEAAAMYTAVLQLKPRYVLELGSGLSSIVLGYAAKRLTEAGNFCEVHSWEESRDYLDDLLPLVPGSLAQNLHLSVATPTARSETPEWLGVRFPGKQKLPYDLIFVDGPEYPEGVPKSSGGQRSFDADVLDVLETNTSNLVVMIDGRSQTVEALREIRPFGTWRLGRFDPLSVKPPNPSRMAIRYRLQQVGRLLFGKQLFPHTFWFWFVPQSPRK